MLWTAAVPAHSGQAGRQGRTNPIGATESNVESSSPGPGGGFVGWITGSFLPAVWSHVKRYGRIFYFAGREFKRDNCPIRAAALAFVMLLSLVPATFVFFIILNAVGVFKKFGHSLRDTLAGQVVPKAEQFDSVREWINTTIDRLVSQVSGDITGVSFNVVSFGAMIVTAALLLTAIEKALNDIWAIKVRRGLIKRFANIWMIITLGPVLIFFSYYFGQGLYKHVTATTQLAEQGWLYDVFIFMLPYLFSVIAFYLLFQFVPYTAVRADGALVGAIFAGVVWEFSKVPFTAYVANVINPTGVYGPLGVIPFFLLWVYLSWVITLFGAELSYCKHNFEIMVSAHKHDEHFLSLYRGYYTIRILEEAVVSFHSGKGPVKVDRVARKLKMPLNLCRELAEGLRTNKLLSYTGRDRTHYQLARAPDKITLGDALTGIPVTRLEAPPNAATPADKRILEVFSAVNTHREKTLSSVTFANIAELSEQNEAPGL